MIGGDFCGGNGGNNEVDNTACILACGDSAGIDGRDVIG